VSGGKAFSGARIGFVRTSLYGLRFRLMRPLLVFNDPVTLLWHDVLHILSGRRISLAQVGDIVKLKSGGPHMTVTKVGNNPAVGGLSVWCTWFEGAETKKGSFPAAGVVAVKTEGVD
jgi:uncharacterized protein YodC (DUF2158 family)